jgi:hypothetical protein
MTRGVSFWCWLFSHDEPLWHVGDKGLEWVCPDCQRRCPSVLKHLKPGRLS